MQAFLLDQNSEFHETERRLKIRKPVLCTSSKVIISIDLFFYFLVLLDPCFWMVHIALVKKKKIDRYKRKNLKDAIFI